jgi:hypothetical protein
MDQLKGIHFIEFTLVLSGIAINQKILDLYTADFASVLPDLVSIKGTVSRDFLLQVFSMDQISPSP